MTEQHGRNGSIRADDGATSQLDRRRFLRLAGATSGLVATGAALAACGSTASAAGGHSSVRPRRGGTLRAGVSGGSSADTLSPYIAEASPDFARMNQILEPLMQYGSNAEATPVLAAELSPNSDGSVWDVRVRSGITFHNGKTLGADDVIYSIQQYVDPKNAAVGALPLSFVDVSGLKQLDALTARIPCNGPVSAFPYFLCDPNLPILPVGFDPKRPVGTGPYRLGTFVPGQQSVFIRNNNYWQTGLPYCDRVEIYDVPDETTQINGLQGGQFDVVNELSAASMNTVRSGGADLLISHGGGWNPFTMRVDQPPFNDVRVRQAMRLVVDRQQMLEQVFGGVGTIGNDIFSIWDPLYDHELPQRVQDIDQAKYLLKQAGYENLAVTLVTSSIAEGVVDNAQVFVGQASAAGIKVNLQTPPVGTFFGPNYLKWTFAMDWWTYRAYFPQVSLATLATAPFNETHWNDPQYAALYREGLAQLDTSKRREIVHEMQTIEYERGGYIVPYFPPVIDAYASTVHGTISSRSGFSFNNWDFKSLWID
jgi:peptide/nickel transport system substrate-binding protein